MIKLNTLKTQGLFDGKFTKLFKSLYEELSVKPFPDKLGKCPSSLMPYLETIYGAFDLDVPKLSKFDDSSLFVDKKAKDGKRVIVAFSGGKDSVALTLKLLHAGYKPLLFFTNGINKSYTKEVDSAKAIASKLGCELVMYSVQIKGKKEYIEHPMKNQFILAAMVDEGLKVGIHKFAFGTTKEDVVELISNDYMLSDGYEMFTSIEKFYKHYIKDFKILIPLANETESICLVNEYGKDLLGMIYSCMLPVRCKKNIVSKNEAKFGIKLLPNRCGSCYKCCQESMVLNELGWDFPDEYIEHCHDVINNAQDNFDKTTKGNDDRPWVDYDIIAKYRGKVKR